MEVTLATWMVSLTGILLIGIILGVQAVAVVRPRAEWTVKNVYGGSPDRTNPTAYFAFNQGFAWADVFFWAPLQLVGGIGMFLGARWGFLLALLGSVPFCYTAIQFFIWDRDMGFRKKTFTYWFTIWGMFPVYGAIEMAYCFWRLV